MPSWDRVIPRLRDPTRQTAARGTKSGRSARDDTRKIRHARGAAYGLKAAASRRTPKCSAASTNWQARRLANAAIKRLSLFVQSTGG